MDDSALLKAIYDDLQMIKAVLTGYSGSDARIWSDLLIQEFTMGVDLDNNGAIFGHNFLFHMEIEFLPPSLRGLQNEYTDSWKGKRLNIIEYLRSLPEGDLKNQVIKWQETARERN